MSKNSLDENPPQNQLTSIKDYTPEQVVLEIGQLRDNEKKDIINRSLLKIEEQRKEIEDSSCKNELEKAKEYHSVNTCSTRLLDLQQKTKTDMDCIKEVKKRIIEEQEDRVK
ncbi:hypothetical protein RhiirC2_789955 [Rhizophagus irregularis]|uniref:Uncharacterized protein n=1 Tax=Rhizophagus irregularis TaxID=588596 RepID=A0A2N1MM52_9GLOM|nr:hypothetical protein RhiirC2_789955 [Rhizophagus irregularis]